jgi:hypothetical protein
MNLAEKRVLICLIVPLPTENWKETVLREFMYAFYTFSHEMDGLFWPDC